MSHPAVSAAPNPSGSSGPPPVTTATSPGGSRSSGSLLNALTMPLVLAAFATYLLVGILGMKVPDSVDFPGPRFFPAIITAVLYALVVVQVINVFRAWARGDLNTTDPDAPAHPFAWGSLAWVVGGFLLFSLLLEFLGWVIGAALLFWCVAQGFGAKKPLMSLIVGLTVSSLAYIAFDMALGLSLPSGILGGGF